MNSRAEICDLNQNNGLNFKPGFSAVLRRPEFCRSFGVFWSAGVTVLSPSRPKKSLNDKKCDNFNIDLLKFESTVHVQCNLLLCQTISHL